MNDYNLTEMFPKITEKYSRYQITVARELYNQLLINSDEEGAKIETWINTLMHQIFKSMPDYAFSVGECQVKIIKTHLPDFIVLHASVVPVSETDKTPVVRIRIAHESEIPNQK